MDNFIGHFIRFLVCLANDQHCVFEYIKTKMVSMDQKGNIFKDKLLITGQTCLKSFERIKKGYL